MKWFVWIDIWMSIIPGGLRAVAIAVKGWLGEASEVDPQWLEQLAGAEPGLR
jgi:hypothetical protein